VEDEKFAMLVSDGEHHIWGSMVQHIRHSGVIFCASILREVVVHTDAFTHAH